MRGLVCTRTAYIVAKGHKMTIDDLIPKKEVIEMITKTANLSDRHVRDRVLKRSDFPKPRKQLGRASVYARQDIEKWLGIK